MLAGLLVWTLLIDPGSHKRLTTGGRIALAAAMFARRPGAHGRARLLVPPALPVLPRRLRVLCAHRPAARRRRDDGGAAASCSGRLRSCCCARACVTRAWRPRERHRLLVRARLSRAGGRRRGRVRPGGAKRPSRHAGRRGASASGCFLVAASLNSPLETIAAHRLLLVHLLQNALIADIAPLLVLLGLTPAMIALAQPRTVRGTSARATRCPRGSSRGTERISRASTTGRSSPAGR